MPEDTTPRLAVAPIDPGNTYAPWPVLAIAACALAILFALLLVILGLMAFRSKEPLTHSWLLGLAMIALGLAFAARRQIQNSENTLSGLSLANAAWWISLVGGLGFLTYLFTIDLTIRRDAERSFVLWVDQLKQADPTDDANPPLLKAFYLTIPPERRVDVGGEFNDLKPNNLELLRQKYGPSLEFQTFRSNELFPLIRRNPDRSEFRTEGLKKWKQVAGRIECELVVTLVNAEGEFPLAFPMLAVVHPTTSVRNWQIARPEGFMAQDRPSRLTEYGWLVRRLEETATLSGNEYLRTLNGRIDQQPKQEVDFAGTRVALPIVLPNLTELPLRLSHDVFVTQSVPAKTAYQILDTSLARTSATGALGLFWPGGPGFQENLKGDFLTALNKKPLSEEDRRRLTEALRAQNEGRLSLLPFSNKIDAFPDKHVDYVITAQTVELHLPMHVKLNDALDGFHAARGRLVVALADPAMVAKVWEMRQGAMKFVNERPADLAQLSFAWKVVRIESDCKTVNYRSRAPGGGSGGDMGMPGQ